MTAPSANHLTDPETLRGETLEIRDRDAYRHLFRSRRLAVGDSLRVVDGEGGARLGVIHSIGRDSAEVALGESLPDREPELRLHLYVGALRPERASRLVEKATELGVFSITFTATERTPRQYGSGRLDRLGRVADAAVEQCGRSRRPRLDGVIPWPDVLDALEPDSSFVLDPGGRPLDRSVLAPAGRDVTLLIGPEGGFSDPELKQLQERGVVALKLGESVLRVETAAVAACALWLLPVAPREENP